MESFYSIDYDAVKALAIKIREDGSYSKLDGTCLLSMYEAMKIASSIIKNNELGSIVGELELINSKLHSLVIKR
jgi:hypothetical protein